MEIPRVLPQTLQKQLSESRRHPHQQPCDGFERIASPSPEEIRERCEEIQREWSDRDRALRAGTNRNAAVEIKVVPSRLETYDTDKAWEYLLQSGGAEPTGCVYGKGKRLTR